MLEILCDVVRGLGALWVFTYHFRPSCEGIWLLASVGDLGVPAFFVISGYCILAAAQRTDSAFKFLKRRLTRIYPAFWASILVVMAVPFLTGYWVRPLWFDYTWTDWLLVVSLGRVFFGHGKPLYTTFVNINAVYWSLAIEVQFYLVMFAALLWRRHFNRIMIGITIAGFAAMAWPPLRNSGLFLAYWPMFSVGMGLKWVLDRPVPRFWKSGLAAAAAIACGVVVCDIIIPVPVIYPLLFAAACALVLWMASPIDRYFKALAGLGTFSYSIYLLHSVLCQLPTAYLQRHMNPYTVLAKGIVMAVTLIACYGFYLIAEKPFLARSARKRPAIIVPCEDVPDNSHIVDVGLRRLLRGTEMGSRQIG